MDLITNNEILISIGYFFIIIIIGWFIKSRNQNNYPEYKYFLTGLILKMLGVLVFCLIYVFYYQGGDTVNYFIGAKC